MLLKFSVQNYKSFAQESAVSLVSDQLEKAIPQKDKDWVDVVHPVLGIFGPNASGKTTLLRAIGDLSAAVTKPGFRLHKPCAMVPILAQTPTEYRLSFVTDGVRYEYQVKAESWGISSEILYAYPKPSEKVKRISQRLLFERTQKKRDRLPTIKAGATLRGATQEVAKITRANSLFLGVAREYGHEILAPIARSLSMSQGILPLMHSEAVRENNIHWISRQVAEEGETWEKITDALIKVADFGIARVEVDEREISPEDMARLRIIFSEGGDEEVEIPDELLQMIKRSLTFYHYSVGGVTIPLSINAQSDGTKAWLALAGRAVEAIKSGKTLVVDELDSSLHPSLVTVLIEMFKDSLLNKSGAQIIFNSHNINLLGNSPSRVLDPQEVCFTQKNSVGISSVYSLTDFSVQEKNNVEKRYLAGAFGAIPDIHVSALQQCMMDEGR